MQLCLGQKLTVFEQMPNFSDYMWGKKRVGEISFNFQTFVQVAYLDL